jgi:hypothetical protein|nr:MAG TPA: hypothetical protein [Caudoviricetes sp.]
MPSFRFVLPTLVRDEVNQGLRFFDVWELVPEWAEDKIGQHIYYAFADDVPIFPISEPGVPDKVSPETVAQAWSAIMYVGVLGDRHALAQARREWQLELNKRNDVPDRYKKTEDEIMEQYQKDLWYVPPRLSDIPQVAEPDLSHQPKPGEIPPEDSEPAPEQPPVHIPSNDELEAEMKAKEAEEHKDNPQGEPSSEPKSEVENPQETPKELDSHSEEVQPESSPEESSTPKEEESQVEPEAHAEDPQPSTPESEEAPSETVSESEPDQDSEEETSEEDLPTPPRPKAALATWRKFAEKIGVEVDKSLSRDEIVEYIKSVRPELFKESE